MFTLKTVGIGLIVIMFLFLTRTTLEYVEGNKFLRNICSCVILAYVLGWMVRILFDLFGFHI